MVLTFSSFTDSESSGAPKASRLSVVDVVALVRWVGASKRHEGRRVRRLGRHRTALRRKPVKMTSIEVGCGSFLAFSELRLMLSDVRLLMSKGKGSTNLAPRSRDTKKS